MAWEEIESGVYRAGLGGSEKIYHRVSGLFAHLKKEHYRVHCACSLEFGAGFQGRDPAAALKEAWKTLRTELPTLGVIADGSNHKIYRVLDAQAEQDWLDRTFFLEPPGKTSNEVIAREPSDFPTLHFLPSSSEVVFLCSHWRIDALGTNWVLDRLLTLLATPATANPVPPTIDAISPALEDAYGAPDPWTPEQEEYARFHIQRFRENSFPNDRLRYKGDAQTPPGNPVRATIIFTRESTAALIAACKSHDITVTTATMAALGQAVFALADLDGREKCDYTFATSINVRPKLQPPYDTRAHATQTYVAGTGCRVRRGANLIESAQALRQHFKAMYDDDRILQSLRAIYRFNSDATPVNQKKGPAVNGALPKPETQAPPPPPSNITISSLGIIDEYVTGEYGKGADGKPVVRVREYNFGIEMMTRQMVTYVGTFQGRLQLAVSYNDGYYDEDVPKDVLIRVKEALAQGLGLELEAS
ncbi:hypothetical protein BP6252_13307 [Coleophoma cylindrospora]|uniref:Phthiocerol/phthiodiolone dimycocerosyl transferase C-terminal domain-containing protein n=1 Tax=Coleophoma cylindrospora TaxID=1849047 RepID=A0A3D8QAM4_9HELO|nr:hypothetical protein BP6252_13307 [Coleophoma cylindrospora]